MLIGISEICQRKKEIKTKACMITIGIVSVIETMKIIIFIILNLMINRGTAYGLDSN